ncbi:bile acid:sodium symporter family protein [Consotaella aegiceratis]|uniref:bile acid:sodium symporter family protein n=1 Tax=Consotaella aegiceratis TaxID=3097961 RepID=UPI002F41AFCF
MPRLKIDGFVLALVVVVAAAIIWPEPGRTGGLLHWELITTYGVCIVFFLYGLTLAPERMRQGLTRWKAHLMVVLTTFVIFPVVVLAAESLGTFGLPEAASIGFFYVAALPSTVSSSVAMVSLARGNVPVAIFNATLSSLLAVFVTPALMAWYLKSSGAPVPLLPTVMKVVLLVLLPIVLGQIARHWLAGWASRRGRMIKLADRGVILAIVYGAFCDSVSEGLFSRTDPATLIEIAALAILLFFIVFALTALGSKLLGMTRDDTIAVQFCGSKKSLATGVPLAPIIFAGRSDIGLIILPIMMFHFFQLLIVSVIAARYARQVTDEEPAKAARVSGSAAE